LASGSFGQVSLGTFKGKKVAIKVFKGVLDSVKKEFQAELEIYLKLR
jgi:predicted unusual protein kinase regulating ubiquinone biosynthesis (AarF/ABC1/UbiB family)